MKYYRYGPDVWYASAIINLSIIYGLIRYCITKFQIQAMQWFDVQQLYRETKQFTNPHLSK